MWYCANIKDAVRDQFEKTAVYKLPVPYLYINLKILFLFSSLVLAAVPPRCKNSLNKSTVNNKRAAV